MTLKNKKVSTKYEVRSTKANSRRVRTVLRTSYLVLFSTLLFFILSSETSCNIYRFRDVSIPDSIRTVKINFIENRARLVNPQLSQRLTERLRQKIIGQTRLTQTNNDVVDWEVSGFVTDYSLSTSAISGQREAANRLTVSVHVTLVDHKADKTQEYDVSRSFEFSATQSLQQAEAALGDEMIRTLTDEIFNKLFSNW
jgi:hypothetical protein